jgi:iron complex transport system substrate-binding protein
MGRRLLPFAAVMLLATAAHAQDLSFTDQSGRAITLQGPAERIVTIPIPPASMLIALDGGTERLAGMHPLAKTALLEGVLGDFFPDAKAIPSDVVGENFVPNVEELVALQPDLVFQWAHYGSDIVDPLVNAGLTVATFNYGTEELARGWIDIMGTAIGKTDKGERLKAWRDEVLADIEAQRSGLADADRPRTMYFLRFLNGLQVAGDDVFQNVSIDIAGGVNPATDATGWRTVNKEQILAWDPEVILLNGFESELTPQHVYDDPVLADVTAVRERRVYKMPLGGYRWDPPNQESPLSWTWLAMVLHPDRFDFPLRDMIADSYGWIYGQTPSAAQIDGILRLEINGDAAGYDRFRG